MSMYRMRYISQTQCLRRQVVTRRGMSTRRTAAGTTQARPEGAGCVRFRLVVPVDLGRRARYDVRLARRPEHVGVGEFRYINIYK